MMPRAWSIAASLAAGAGSAALVTRAIACIVRRGRGPLSAFLPEGTVERESPKALERLTTRAPPPKSPERHLPVPIVGLAAVEVVLGVDARAVVLVAVAAGRRV
jgi:hypothetical protein